MRSSGWGLGCFMLLWVAFGCSHRPPYEGKSVAQLERMLHDPSSTVQAQGAYGLSRLGPAARSAVPALREALKGESLVRQHAAQALGQIGPEAAEATDDLVTALRDPEWTVRRQAALALGQIGPAGRSALPHLERLRRDPDNLVRQAAAFAIKQIRQ